MGGAPQPSVAPHSPAPHPTRPLNGGLLTTTERSEVPRPWKQSQVTDSPEQQHPWPWPRGAAGVTLTATTVPPPALKLFTVVPTPVKPEMGPAHKVPLAFSG